MTNVRQGKVVRTDAKVCHVEVEGRIVLAAPRGILYGSGAPRAAGDVGQKNPVAVGDDVEVELSGAQASLDRVLPRRNYLSRIASSHDPREQVLAANIDQLVVVGSLAKPGFSSNRTDRILAACTWQHIPCIVLLNKRDLVEEDEVEPVRNTYERVPVRVLETSATAGTNIEELRELLRDKTTVLYGASGAGKSTLLNALEPSLALKVGKISKFWDQGKHTTTFSQLHRLAFGATVIDTPGIRVFRPFGVPTENLRDLFPEFSRFQRSCQFPDCSHDHEPDCAVFEAVDSGELAASRYASYVEMLDEARRAPSSEDVEGSDME